jgi:hypothetical protein
VAIKCCYGDDSTCSPPARTLYIHKGTVSVVSSSLARTLLDRSQVMRSEPTEIDLTRLIREAATPSSDASPEIVDLASDDDGDVVFVECEPCKHVCKVRLR